LVDALEKNAIPFSFLSLKSSFWLLFFAICSSHLIHLHCSNVYFRYLMACFCYITRKKLWITYHGNLGRYHSLKNRLDYWSVGLVSLPIVLNEHSLKKARKWNEKARLISSFIPPQYPEQLSDSIKQQLRVWRTKYKLLCSTNVSNVAFDDSNREIYGILPLLELFEHRQTDCLLVSDASGRYLDYVLTQREKLPPNVYFILEQHSYYALLHEVDCMIRNTVTDGDAISIKEALYLNKYVCATDVVPRHEAVNSYRTMEELDSLLNHYHLSEQAVHISGEEEWLALYRNECVDGNSKQKIEKK
jgi:hypothetical protein